MNARFLVLLAFASMLVGAVRAATGDVSVAVAADGKSAYVTVAGFTTGASYAFGVSGANNTPSAATPYLDITGVGFNGTTPGTRTRRVYLTGWMRQAVPNQNLKDEVGGGNLTFRASLSKPVYVTDNTGAGKSGTAPTFTAPAGFVTNTGGGSQQSNAATAVAVTNNSTLAGPDPIGAWDWSVVKPYTRKTGDFQIGYRATHAFGISAVILDAVGASSGVTVSQTFTMVSRVGPSAAGTYWDSYVMTVPITGFTQGEQIQLRARVYPRFGDTTNIIDTETLTTISQSGLSRVEVTCDKTGALTTYAVVKTLATGGLDASGATSASLATARTTPYSTIAGAMNANASVIILTDDGTGTHAFTQTPVKSQPYCIEIRPDPADVAANITMTMGISSLSVRCKHLMLAGGYTVSLSSGTTYFDGEHATYDSTFLADGVKWSSASTSGLADVNDFRLVNWMNVTTTDWKMAHSGTTGFAFSAMGCVLGSTASVVGIDTFGQFVGNSQGASSYRLAVTDGAVSNPLHIARNIMFDNNRLDRYAINSSANGFKFDDATDGDVSIRGNLIVNSGTVEGDNFVWSEVAGDNLVFGHNTVQGMPFSFVYNATTNSLSSNIFASGNALYRQSTKTDTFTTADGSRIGNWGFVFGVGLSNNRIDGSVGFLPGETGGQSPAGFTGLNAGLVGGSGTYTELGYTQDNSRVGAGGGGGNYLPTSGSVLRNAMQASDALISYDLFGTAVPASGTMDIGAVLNAPANASSSISITSPANGATVASPVTLTGTATDPEDGVLSSSITWSSNVAGSLGTGATISPSLAVGAHTITASVTDSGSQTTSTSINITVSAPAGTINAGTTNATTITIGQ